MIKKIIPYLLILVLATGILVPIVKLNAQSTLGTCIFFDFTKDPKLNVLQTDCPTTEGSWTANTNMKDGETTDDKNYHYLAPLPGVGETFDPTQTGNLGAYLNIMINLFIGICAVLAVIMIVMGGLEYMTSELISSKEHGKERITGAIFGLILALGAWTLLYTINPDLLNTELSSLKNVEVTVTLEPDAILGKETTINGKPATACKTEDMVSISLFGKNVTVNKNIKDTLLSIDTAWKAMPEATRYKVNTVFGYNCREVRNMPGYWSTHAFGVGIDINQATNPSHPTKLTTDMPESFIALFTSRGWGWGGSWAKPKDAMHFSSTNK